jgi:hypothetical protein
MRVVRQIIVEEDKYLSSARSTYQVCARESWRYVLGSAHANKV